MAPTDPLSATTSPRWTNLYRRLTGSDPTDSPFWVPARAVARWVVVFYRELVHDRAFQLAAALAYGTLVALVPMLLLAFAVLDTAGLLARDQGAIESLVFGTFLGDIPQVRDFLLPGLLRINFRAVGAISTAGWVFVAARIYMMMEQAYSQIFRVPVDRPFGRRLMNFYLALTAGPLLIGLALFATLRVAAELGVTWWGDALSIAVPVVLFTGAIKLLPSTTVRWVPAMTGGLVSAVLVEIGAIGFTRYVQTFASQDPIVVTYGSIGLIPVFLLWLYLLWVFVLLGVEVAHVVQNFRSLVRAEQELRAAEQERHLFPSIDTALEIAAVISRAFLAGQGPLRTSGIAQQCGISEYRAQSVLEILAEGDILSKTEQGWTMRRPPERVTVREVVQQWRSSTRIRKQVRGQIEERLGGIPEPALDVSLSEVADHWLASTEPAEPATSGS